MPLGAGDCTLTWGGHLEPGNCLAIVTGEYWGEGALLGQDTPKLGPRQSFGLQSHPVLQLRPHHGAIQVGLGCSLLSFGAQQWQGWLHIRFDLFWAKQKVKTETVAACQVGKLRHKEQAKT